MTPQLPSRRAARDYTYKTLKKVRSITGLRRRKNFRVNNIVQAFLYYMTMIISTGPRF